jgi:hypothetical protein
MFLGVIHVAISDVVDAVTGVNHFKSFFDKLYSLYSQSSKNRRELADASTDLNVQVRRIGKILDTRWVASSVRTVRAVWQSYDALYEHFQRASVDTSRDSKTRATFRGLLNKFCSPQFLSDLALMLDALEELANLSLDLQRRTMTIPAAEVQIQRTAPVLESMKDTPGESVTAASASVAAGRHHGLQLVSNAKIVTINSNQFLQSLADNVRKRLVDPGMTNTTMSDMRLILDKDKWPMNMSVQFGKPEIMRLSNTFQIDVTRVVRGMRAYVEGEENPSDLQELMCCTNTIPCSSSECERDFSLMNNIATDNRAVLTVQHIADEMYISTNGPPASSWQPDSYVKSWLKTHRCADDVKSRTVQRQSIAEDRAELWKLL